MPMPAMKKPAPYPSGSSFIQVCKRYPVKLRHGSVDLKVMVAAVHGEKSTLGGEEAFHWNNQQLRYNARMCLNISNRVSAVWLLQIISTDGSRAY